MSQRTRKIIALAKTGDNTAKENIPVMENMENLNSSASDGFDPISNWVVEVDPDVLKKLDSDKSKVTPDRDFPFNSSCKNEKQMRKSPLSEAKCQHTFNAPETSYMENEVSDPAKKNKNQHTIPLDIKKWCA
ncbi:unnamed protein product [Acanthoscelides obtectus]|uniref:Uncharacterized protein n=1 Tax=Acanthoscelides obtectus TaxID=200917 RepID=A0A9P0NSP4_ACAOB|nr:unnamed protein product [Acanthoscelides obtectus]CAK1641376.1 hypothetical protein AOBTE_LOCUS12371 [Acanthoscelides obtectus]